MTGVRRTGFQAPVLVLLSCLVVVGTAVGSGGKTHTLYFLSMLPYPDPRPSFQSLYQDGPEIVPAAYLAVEHINKRSDILSDYHIELIESNGGCNINTRAVEAFVVSVFSSGQQVVGIVGPGCSDSAIAVSTMCSHSEIALVTVHIANSPLLTDRENFPYAFATTDTSLASVQSIAALMRHNNWRSVALVYDVNAVIFLHLAEELQEEIHKLADYDIALVAPLRTEVSLPVSELHDSFARIIIAIVGGQRLCELLCLAHHRRLVFPAYQWVFINPPDCDTGVNSTGEYSCTKEEVAGTLPGVMSIERELTAPDSPQTVSNLTAEEFQMQYKLAVLNYGSPNPTSPLGDFFYDGVWSLALALNSSDKILKERNTSLNLSDYHYGRKDITEIVKEQFYQLDFSGITGQVNFDPSNGGRNFTVTLLQHTDKNVSQPEYAGRLQHNEWDILKNVSVIPGEFPSEFTHLPYSAVIVILLLTGVIATSVALSQVLTVAYRNYKSVKASSPTLNHLVFFGCYLLLMAAVAYMLTRSFNLTYETDFVLCNTTLWFVSLGLTLVLGTVCAKTWRLYDVFGISSRRLSKNARLSNRVLSLGVLILVLIDTTVCTVWTAIDPPVQHIVQTLKAGDHNKSVAVEHTCQSENDLELIMLPLLFVYKFILLAWSAHLAFLTRRISMELFKTRNVTRLVYMFCLVSGIGVPALFLAEHLELNTVASVIFCVLLNVFVILCLAFLFIPPLRPILKHKSESVIHTLIKSS